MSHERDILIEGRGLAGHNLATKLADNGWNVLLSGQEYKTKRSWFVLKDRLPNETQEMITNGTIPSHNLDACRFVIVNSETSEVIHDFSSKTSGKLNDHACVMIDDKATKNIFRERATSQSNVTEVASKVKTVKENGNGYKVVLNNGDKHVVSSVVDASGSASNVVRRLENSPLKDDALVFWIYGYKVTGEFDPKTMIFPLKDRESGRMSWISPWSSEVADVLAADYCRVSEFSNLIKNGTFQQTYDKFKYLSEGLGLCRIDAEQENIHGRIRVVPIKPNIERDGIYAVGDAAGQACPNMAEGVPPAIRNSNYLATRLNEDGEYSGSKHYKDWRHGPNKIEPFELSAVFLLDRLPLHQAGSNAKIYKSIANSHDVEKMLRITSDRKLNLSDIPELIRLGVVEPELLTRAASVMIRSRFAFTSPKYQEVLYGE